MNTAFIRGLFACVICSILLSAAAGGATRRFSGSGIAQVDPPGKSYMMRLVSGADVTSWMDGTCVVTPNTPGSDVAMCFGTKNVGHGYILTVDPEQQWVTISNDNFESFEIDFSVSANPDVVYCRLPIYGMCELLGVYILDHGIPTSTDNATWGRIKVLYR